MGMVKTINLALQGGGAHGAFTWGVLDALLDCPDVEIAGISGTSAGALNGAAVKAGLSCGSRQAAKDNLAWVWQQIGAITDEHFAPWLQGAVPSAINKAIEGSIPFAIGDVLGRTFSPYATGPFYINPLRRIVDAFEYDDIHCTDRGPQFFICATNVRSGKIRIFTGDELGPDAVMASACLPTLFRAVDIKDPKTGKIDAYWDGGYTGNPALFPLFAPELPRDILIVNINPLYREDVPKSARAIQNRINEISFNSSLLRELRAIEFVQRLLKTGGVRPGSMKDMLIHMIADDALMQDLSVATKLVATPQILHQLHQAGRAACAAFLDTHFDTLGNRSSVDLPAMYA
jgi:NTE family protein